MASLRFLSSIVGLCCMLSACLMEDPAELDTLAAEGALISGREGSVRL
jgi:hypothetical protein